MRYWTWTCATTKPSRGAGCVYWFATTATASSTVARIILGFAEYYGTVRIGILVTLVVKGGGVQNYGDSDEIPFYKFTSLGLNENLRGYYRNRFTGDASLYLNSELRLALGRRNRLFALFLRSFRLFRPGRVYYKGASPDGWHDGYGAGFYISPVRDQLALSLAYQKSPENGLIRFGVGFRIDQ